MNIVVDGTVDELNRIAEYMASSILKSWTRISREEYPKIWFHQCYLKKPIGEKFLPRHLVDMCIDVSTGIMIIEHCPYWAIEEERAPFGRFKGKASLCWTSVRWKAYKHKLKEEQSSSDSDKSPPLRKKKKKTKNTSPNNLEESRNLVCS
jgi:hypothetical protein